jgi:hypothetical protein
MPTSKKLYAREFGFRAGSDPILSWNPSPSPPPNHAPVDCYQCGIFHQAAPLSLSAGAKLFLNQILHLFRLGLAR